MVVGIGVAVPGGGLLAAGMAAGQTFGFGIAFAVMVVLGGLSAVSGWLLFTIGAGIHVFGPIRSRERAAQEHSSYGTILGCLYFALLIANLLVGLASLGLMLAGYREGRAGVAGQRTIGVDGLIVATYVQELVIFAILYLRIVRPGVIGYRTMGLVPRRLVSQVALGVLTGFGALALSMVLGALFNFMGLRQTQTDLFAPLRQATPLQFVVMLAGVSLLTAFVEESFFRGYVFRALCARRGARHAYLASALIFAALHFPPLDGKGPLALVGSWVALFVPVFAIGIVFAYVYRRTGSLIPTIVAHAVNNGTVLAVVYFVKDVSV